MKLIPVLYFGFTGMDSRFSSPMLPWIVSEIRKRDFCEKLSLGVDGGVLQAYNPDFELQFSHKINQMIRFSQADLDASTFLYILKDDSGGLLYCYMYQAQSPQDVAELYKQMKEQSSFQPSKSLSSANLTSLCVDISPSLSNFFEVFYIGKIKVWNRKVPDTFIDDALERFKAHELEKKQQVKLLANIGRLKSEDMLIRRCSTDSNVSEASSDSLNCHPLQRSVSSSSSLATKASDVQLAEDVQTNSQRTKYDEDHNRTMLLQVDRTDLRLISPDRKIILLHKNHKDVIACLQGISNKEHFGFISIETGNGQGYTGFVFKCKSDGITSETVSTINQAFSSSAEIRPKPVTTSCEHCPMIWFHKLCTEIENLSDKKTQSVILKKIEQLDEDEQNTIMTKFRGAETDSIIEQNEFLMMLLRAHCEVKQGRHVHDSAENRSEFLNQYLGGGTIFMKAKRSLSNSFEMLKKRASRDDFSATLREMNLPLNKENVQHSSTSSINNDVSDKESEEMRSRSSTIDSQKSEIKDSRLVLKEAIRQSSEKEKALKSPMMDIFFKVGSPKSNSDEMNSPKTPDGSWRQAIFKKVVTPKPKDELFEKKSKEELRILWKKAIHQAILLVRMEKENATLKAKQEESAVKRIKLEYDEMKPNQREISQVWDLITDKNSGKKIDKPILSNAIRQGIPRGKRGDVWQFLAHQYCMNNPPIDATEFPHYNTPYETLLKELTLHQHAILIDLGRTFPNHSYFSSPLGPGQLSLFNLLKAYSLLDPEVGYCQGLSFVVGVLLLHMEESKAFFLLRHLMFRRGLRRQYLPDMTGLQIKLYQLSRLLHDKLPDLYEHLNNFDISPSLYAAPWILTIFASQFPLGFVTRVFDLLFMEGLDIVFRVALALLTLHKDNILARNGFEEIMEYLKENLTQIDNQMLEKIIKIVFITDISKKLTEYEVEYNVLQEEMLAVQPQVEQIQKLEFEIKRLKEQNKKLNSQLELTYSNVQRLEKGRTIQQSEINRHEMQNRGLEVTVSTLGRFINNLIDERKDIEIPGDVRRIVSQITFMEKRKNENKNSQRVLVKSLSTGKIQLSPNRSEEFRTSSLNNQSRDELRTSNFFSNQHNNILKQKVFSNNNISPSISSTSIKESDNEDNEKNNNDNNETIPTSPNNNTNLTRQISENETNSLVMKIDDGSVVNDNHPLSNCDVNFTYNGTRELKHFKNMRVRMSSPNLLNSQ